MSRPQNNPTLAILTPVAKTRKRRHLPRHETSATNPIINEQTKTRNRQNQIRNHLLVQTVNPAQGNPILLQAMAKKSSVMEHLITHNHPTRSILTMPNKLPIWFSTI